MKHTIGIYGCDDCTCFVIDCTDEQLEVLLEVSKKSKEVSTYGCMPTIEIDSDYDKELLKDKE